MGDEAGRLFLGKLSNLNFGSYLLGFGVGATRLLPSLDSVTAQGTKLIRVAGDCTGNPDPLTNASLRHDTCSVSALLNRLDYSPSQLS